MNKLRASLINVFSIFDRVFSFFRSPFLLAVRLYWGWQFAQTGWGKLNHLSKVAEFFASLHIPFPAANALFNGCLEFFGGILFALGLASRPVSLLLSISMMVAYLTADRGQCIPSSQIRENSITLIPIHSSSLHYSS